MNKKMVFLPLILSLAIFLVACIPTPNEAVQKAEENFRQAIIAENTPSLLYDNGKNFLIVNDSGWAVAMVVLQQWVDDHPEKRIVAFAIRLNPDDVGSDGWLVYYEDR